MKSILIYAIVLLLAYTDLFSESEWQNFTNLSRIACMLNDGDFLWVGTDGGVVKMNKNTEEKFYMNKANMNLPDNSIICLAKDKEGKMWMGGAHYGMGVLKNGIMQNFNTKNSGIPSNQLNYAITTDSDGSIWFASLNNLVKFDGNNWQSWPTGNPIMSNNYISGIVFDSNGRLWLSGSWGLATLEGDSIKYIPEVNIAISDLSIDSKNNLWLSSSQYGLICYNGQTYQYFNKSNSELPSNNIINMTIDNLDNIWISSDLGLTKFSNGSAVNHSLKDIGLENYYISDIEIDNNVIWIGSTNGIIKYDGNNFKPIDINNCKIGDNYVSDIAIDSSNNIYFASNCVSKYDGNQNWGIIAPPMNKTFYNSVSYSTDGKLWIGKYFSAFSNLDSSVIYYKNGTVVAYDSTQTKASKYSVVVISIDKTNNIWFGTDGGLFKYDSENWYSFNRKNSSLTTNNIRDLKFDSNGNLWGTCGNSGPGTNDGCLFKYDGANWKIFQKVDSNIKSNFFDALTIDSKSNIWVSVRDSGNFVGSLLGEGLLKFDGNKWTRYNIYNSPLPSNTIFDIFCDNEDILWIGTMSGGLVKFDGKNDWKIFNVINSGISNNDINVIKKDLDDNIWIGHNRGGVSLFKENSTSVENKSIENKDNLKLSPNPVSDLLRINLSNCENASVNIYNNLGISIIRRNISQSDLNGCLEISTNDLPNGIYYCNVSEGNYSKTQKFIIIK